MNNTSVLRLADDAFKKSEILSDNKNIYIQGFFDGFIAAEKEVTKKYQDQFVTVFWKNINTEINDEFQPGIPKTTKEIYQKYVIPGLYRCGAIPKSKLKIGVIYKGYCRNASEAVWLGDKFEYDRYKFGITYKETINHFEDDNGYDLFVPYASYED